VWIAAQPRAPIVIADCRPIREIPIGRRPGALAGVFSFTISGGRVADTVRFSMVMSDGNVHTFTAHGRFSPNTFIEEQQLALESTLPVPDYRSDRRSTCSAALVHFVDGTTWVAPT
jgi:hypothetical protein